MQQKLGFADIFAHFWHEFLCILCIGKYPKLQSNLNFNSGY